MLMHWSQLVPNNVSWHPRTLRNTTAYEGLQGWGADSLWWQSVPAPGLGWRKKCWCRLVQHFRFFSLYLCPLVVSAAIFNRPLLTLGRPPCIHTYRSQSCLCHMTVTCDSEWVTNLSKCIFKYPYKLCTNSVTWLLHGWCHMQLMPSWCTFCLHHTTMHQFKASCHATPRMYCACVFSCNLPPTLLAEWLGSFTCYCGNMGVERIPK